MRFLEKLENIITNKEELEQVKALFNKEIDSIYQERNLEYLEEDIEGAFGDIEDEKLLRNMAIELDDRLADNDTIADIRGYILSDLKREYLG